MSLAPWVVNASRYLWRDRWLTVRADSCVTPGGASLDPYYVLEYPNWVHMVGVDDEKRILVVHQYRHALGRVFAELPGGIVDAVDASPLAAAQREMREETGCAAGRWEALGTLCPNPATHTNTLYAFLAWGCHQIAAPSPEATEDLRTEFVPVPALLAMIDTGEFAHGLHIASLLRALRHPDLSDPHH